MSEARILESYNSR